jgi:hypothetical protein
MRSGAFELIDRADGVRGHFCIGRRKAEFGWEVWEFFNNGKWESAGEVFYSRTAAERKLKQLLKEKQAHA